ncbi:hypothetical protein P8452_43604 [Trifolium repens]|nr:hypothetical protein P8452_43604 [Trifolium repens]
MVRVGSLSPKPEGKSNPDMKLTPNITAPAANAPAHYPIANLGGPICLGAVPHAACPAPCAAGRDKPNN